MHLHSRPFYHWHRPVALHCRGTACTCMPIMHNLVQHKSAVEVHLMSCCGYHVSRGVRQVAGHYRAHAFLHRMGNAADDDVRGINCCAYSYYEESYYVRTNQQLSLPSPYANNCPVTNGNM